MALSYYDQYSKDPSLTMDAYGTFYRPDGTAVMQSAENAQAAEMQRLQEANNRISTLNSIDGGNRDQLSGFNYDDNAYFSGAQNFTPSSTPTGTTYNNTKPLSAGGGFSSGGGAASGGGGMSSGGGYGAQNPYLLPMMQSITDQVTSNFNRNVMPQISQQMMATGGYGGSRQGVIEANAMRDMNQGLSNSLANLGLQDFNAQRGYDLGLRNSDLGYAGLDAQIAQNNFGNRLAGANFGLNLFNQGMANNQTGINAGTNIQNTPLNYASNFANQYNSIGQGYGTTTGSTSQQGNPVLGALGGAQLGGRIANGWGGNVGGTSAATQGWTYGGSGTSRGPSDNIDWIYGGG